MTPYDVVVKIIGPIRPVGETNTDSDRLSNLQATIDLVDDLLSDIRAVAINDDRPEASMKLAGETAREFLNNLRDWVK